MKSRIGTNDEKWWRQIVQLFSAPSPRNARRVAPNNPMAQAAAATMGPNAAQHAREPNSRFAATRGGSQGVGGSGSVSAALAGSLAIATGSSVTGTPCRSSRTNFSIRVGSKNPCGIAGHGSRSDTALCMASNRPILSSRP
jgi:hypothetical protein